MRKKIINIIKRNNYNPLIILFKVARFLIRGLFYTVAGGFLFLILTIIWPIQKVKFCGMILPRIGHLAGNTELFVRRLRAGYYDQDCLYIGCNVFGMKPSNRQLLTMFKRNFAIVESRLFGKAIYSLFMRRSKFYQELSINWNEYYEFNDLPPNLIFTKGEEEKGQHELEKMGITRNDWFVCFHARDSMYLNKTFGGDWSYHDFRDCDINNYLKAMEYITKQGGFAIRLGAIVEKPLPELDNYKIIDYATKYRSDFMDIYLSAKCKFFVGNTAGLYVVSAILGVPIAGTNIVHLELSPFRKGDLFLPKKIRNISEDKLLTFPEIFERRIGKWFDGYDFTKAGLEVIENTPDEILGLVQEMNESLDGQFQYTKEDSELHNRYHALIKPYHHCYKNPVRIGTLFLRENKHLLDGYCS